YRVQLKAFIRDPNAVSLLNTVVGIMHIQVHFPMWTCRPFGLRKRGKFSDRDQIAIDIEGREEHLMRRSLMGRTIVSPHAERSARNLHHPGIRAGFLRACRREYGYGTPAPAAQEYQ